MLLAKGICSTEVPHTVVDPDLQIRGTLVIQTLREEGGSVSKKIFFSALWASVWSNNKGATPLGISPRSATAIERGDYLL